MQLRRYDIILVEVLDWRWGDVLKWDAVGCGDVGICKRWRDGCILALLLWTFVCWKRIVSFRH